MLTSPIVKPRILGRSEVPECDNAITLLATGNNVTVVGDLVRRTLSCELDSGLEVPELRHFDFDPIERVLSDQGSFIAAVITIARSYAAAGRPQSMTPLAGYDAWCRLVREPLVWLGESDPVQSVEKARKADPERSAGRELVDGWLAVIGVNVEVTTEEVVSKTYSAISGEVAGAADFLGLLFSHAQDRTGNQIDTARLGKWLRKMSGRVFNRHKIVKNDLQRRAWRLIQV